MELALRSIIIRARLKSAAAFSTTHARYMQCEVRLQGQKVYAEYLVAGRRRRRRWWWWWRRAFPRRKWNGWGTDVWAWRPLQAAEFRWPTPRQVSRSPNQGGHVSERRSTHVGDVETRQRNRIRLTHWEHNPFSLRRHVKKEAICWFTRAIDIFVSCEYWVLNRADNTSTRVGRIGSLS